MLYQKYRKKDLVDKLANMNLTDSNDNSPPSMILTEEEKKDALFFRTCIVNRDKMDLKIKLEQTIMLREEMIKKKKGIKFYLDFPFYFVDPELVRVHC